MGFISVLCVATSLSLIIITISAEDNVGALPDNQGSYESRYHEVSRILQRTQEIMTTSSQAGGCSDAMQQIRDDVDRLQNQLERQQQEIVLCQQQGVATLQNHVSLQDRYTEIREEIHQQGRQTELVWESLATLNQTINNVKCSQEGEHLVNNDRTISVCLQGHFYPFQECSQEGEHLVNNDCTISVCLQGHLYPYQGIRAADVTFEDLVAQGCIHLETIRKSWDDARANCQERNGDMYVAGDLAGALQFMQEQWPGWQIWAGVRGRAWTDGRTVAQQEWGSGQPIGDADECGYIYSNGVNRGVGDRPCTNTRQSICQKGVKYN